MSNWFEDESFWQDFYGFLFPAERFAAAEQEIDKALNLLHLQGNQVLDLACGPGRHSIPLAKKGFQVTAVDRSKYLLEKARNYALETGTQIEWIEEDMRHFVREESFDLAISLFTSFGYFAKPEENLLVLQNIFRSLKPGGYCVLDMMGKERIAARNQSTIVHELKDGALMIERPKVVEDWSRMQNEWLMIRGDRVRRFQFSHSIYSGQELKAMFRQAGFSHVKLYGDLDGHEYGVDAQRLVAVAKK
jgi:ubiquinone/menaquinone biosynthesis C-methylase UbiE